MDARGLGELKMIDGLERSNMVELAMWTEEADKILTF